jgi:hypothetical protein
MLAIPARADDELRTSEPLRCPCELNDRGVKHVLTGTTVFDGKEGDMVELKPDDGKWNFEDYRPSVQSFSLICHFDGIESTIIIPIPPGMRLCEKDGNNVVCR